MSELHNINPLNHIQINSVAKVSIWGMGGGAKVFSSTSIVLLMIQIGAPLDCESICKLPRRCTGHYKPLNYWEAWWHCPPSQKF